MPGSGTGYEYENARSYQVDPKRFARYQGRIHIIEEHITVDAPNDQVTAEGYTRIIRDYRRMVSMRSLAVALTLFAIAEAQYGPLKGPSTRRTTTPFPPGFQSDSQIYNSISNSISPEGQGSQGYPTGSGPSSGCGGGGPGGGCSSSGYGNLASGNERTPAGAASYSDNPWLSGIVAQNSGPSYQQGGGSPEATYQQSRPPVPCNKPGYTCVLKHQCQGGQTTSPGSGRTQCDANSEICCQSNTYSQTQGPASHGPSSRPQPLPQSRPTYGPTQTGSTYVPNLGSPGASSGPAYQPGQPLGPSGPSHQPSGPSYQPGQQSGPSHQPSGPSYQPGQQSGPSHQPSGPSYQPGQPSGPSHQPSGPSYQPGQPSGPSYRPGQPSGPSYQPGQPSGPSYQPGQPSGPSYQPGQPSGPSHQPGQPSGPSYQPGQPSGPSYRPGQPSGPSHQPGQPSGPSYQPGQPSGPSYRPGQPSGPSHQPGQPSGPSYQPGQPSGSYYRPGQSSGPSFQPGQPSGPSYQPGSRPQSLPGPFNQQGQHAQPQQPFRPGTNGIPIGGSIYDTGANRPGSSYVTPAYGPYTGPLNTTPHPGCPAALKCVDEIYCDAMGVMRETPQVLTPEELENKVPLSVCQNIETGIIGKCCRDPNYKDPWPDMNYGDYDDGHFHGGHGGHPNHNQHQFHQQGTSPDSTCGPSATCTSQSQCSGGRQIQPGKHCQVPHDGSTGVCCSKQQFPPKTNNHQINTTPTTPVRRPGEQYYTPKPSYSNNPFLNGNLKNFPVTPSQGPIYPTGITPASYTPSQPNAIQSQGKDASYGKQPTAKPPKPGFPAQQPPFPPQQPQTANQSPNAPQAPHLPTATTPRPSNPQQGPGYYQQPAEKPGTSNLPSFPQIATSDSVYSPSVDSLQPQKPSTTIHGQSPIPAQTPQSVGSYSQSTSTSFGPQSSITVSHQSSYHQSFPSQNTPTSQSTPRGSYSQQSHSTTGTPITTRPGSYGPSSSPSPQILQSSPSLTSQGSYSHSTSLSTPGQGHPSSPSTSSQGSYSYSTTTTTPARPDATRVGSTYDQSTFSTAQRHPSPQSTPSQGSYSKTTQTHPETPDVQQSPVKGRPQGPPAGFPFLAPTTEPIKKKPVFTPAPGLTPQPGAECGIRREGERPNGPSGLETAFGEFPWQVQVMHATTQTPLCSGAILAPKVVVTVAHCVDHFTSAQLSIKAGDWKLATENPAEEPRPAQVRNVGAISRHPKYDPDSRFYDMAVLILSEPLQLDSHVDVLCLGEDTPPGYTPRGSNCVVTGWGKANLQSNVPGSTMHSIPVSFIESNQCEDTFRKTHLGKYFQLNKSFVCAVPTSPENDLCEVDVGSPIVCQKPDGRYELSGLYSWDVGCHQNEKQPTVASKVDKPWVESVMKKPIQQVKAEENAEIAKKESLGFNPDSNDQTKPGFSQGYGRK